MHTICKRFEHFCALKSYEMREKTNGERRAFGGAVNVPYIMYD